MAPHLTGGQGMLRDAGMEETRSAVRKSNLNPGSLLHLGEINPIPGWPPSSGVNCSPQTRSACPSQLQHGGLLPVPSHARPCKPRRPENT